jgi:hypothetical protein
MRLHYALLFLIGCSSDSPTANTILNDAGVSDAYIDVIEDQNSNGGTSGSGGTSQTSSGGHAGHIGIIDPDAGGIVVFESCEYSCTSALNQVSDCYHLQVDCIESWFKHPSWKNYCAVDKKYCSTNSWLIWCQSERTVCNSICISACKKCSDDHNCNLQNYNCTESCSIDYLGN